MFYPRAPSDPPDSKKSWTLVHRFAMIAGPVITLIAFVLSTQVRAEMGPRWALAFAGFGLLWGAVVFCNGRVVAAAGGEGGPDEATPADSGGGDH